MGSAAKPTIVFVHGAWHSPEQYSWVTDRLKTAGYTVKAPYLPSVAAEETLENFDRDVDAVRELIQGAVDNGEDIVIVCHSYGGCPSGEASKGFLKKDRKTQGLKGGVIGMVYMCAFVPDVGQSLGNLVEKLLKQGPVDGKEGSKTVLDDPVGICYGDVDPATVAETLQKLRPQSTGPFFSPVSHAPWKHVPSTYILCEQDQAIEIRTQEKMTDPSRGAKWTLRRLNASHSPFLSMPQEVFEIIEESVTIAQAEEA